jgi:two-component system, cell cycle response regulator
VTTKAPPVPGTDRVTVPDREDTTNAKEAPLSPVAAGENKKPYLIVIAGAHVGELHRLTKRRTVIGRGPRADIRLIDEGVSRCHTEIVLEADGIKARDLGSTNGTYKNGSRAALSELADGDKISIGATTILKFSFQDGLEEAFQRDLYRSAVRDATTQALRKTVFLERLEAEVAFSLRHSTPLALIFWDLDDFKRVNDLYGHPAGDLVLAGTAKAVAAVTRREDMFGRWGGEEFALACRGMTAEVATGTAERIRRLIEETRIDLGLVTLNVTASFGVAFCPAPDVLRAADLLNVADAAMYRAKRAGKNRVEVAPSAADAER